MKKNFAVAMAITAGLCFAGSGHLKAAFAGEWVPITDGLDGTVSYSFDDYYTGSSQHYEASYGWDDYGENSAGFILGGVWFQIYRGSLTLSDVGKRQTQYHWQRDIDFMTGLPDPNDNPPDFLILKVTAGVNGSVCTDLSNPYNDNSDASVTVSLMGESGGTDTSWTDSSGAHFKGLGQTATKLFAIPTDGQEDVSGPWINYGAEIQMDGDRYISPDTNLLGQASIDLSYSPSVDTRKLTLHRAGAINETTDEDGNVHGDTTFSYLTQPSNTLTTNSQVFHPTFEGSWTNGTSSPDVTWAWTPQNLIDQSVPIISPQTQGTGTFATSTGTSYLDTDAGDDSGWTGTADSPQEASLKYEATDNGDGAKATATYFLAVHDEWELDASREDSRYFMEQHDMGVASACPSDPNVNDCPANASVSASFSVTPQIGGGVSGSLGVNIPVINGIGGNINIGGNANGSLSVTGEVSATSNWPTLTLTPGQSAVPVLNVYADHKEYDFRHYTPSGRDLNVGTNGIKTVTTNSFKGMSVGNMLEMTWRYIIEED